MHSWTTFDTQLKIALITLYLLSFFFCHFQPSVRFEACRGLYRLSLIKENSCLIQLMDALLDSLPLAQSLQSRENPHGRRQEPSAREYFSILCRLVDGLPTVEGGQKVCTACISLLIIPVIPVIPVCTHKPKLDNLVVTEVAQKLLSVTCPDIHVTVCAS